MTESKLREYIDDYAPDELAMYACQLDFSLDFMREWKDRIDFFKLQYKMEEKRKQAACVCCYEEMQFWDKKGEEIQELVHYYYEQYFGL